MNGVGYSLLNGLGVEKDVAAALPWLQHAAEFGQPNAMHTLGALYRSGNGVDRDPIESYKWLSLAADRYAPADAERRDRARQLIAEERAALSPADLSEALRRIGEWRPRTPLAPDEQPPPKHTPPATAARSG